jgi:hypothetical protein
MKTPPEVIEKFERLSEGLEFGSVSLVIHMRDGRPRYEFGRRESCLLQDCMEDRSNWDTLSAADFEERKSTAKEILAKIKASHEGGNEK